MGYAFGFRAVAAPVIQVATYNSVTMVQIGAKTRADATFTTWILGLVAPSTGSNTYSVDWAASPGVPGAAIIAAASYTGVAPDDPFRAYQAVEGVGTSAALIVPSEVGDVIVASCDVDTSPTITPDASQTVRLTSSFGEKMSDARGLAGSTNLSWSWAGSNKYIAQAVALRPYVPIVEFLIA